MLGASVLYRGKSFAGRSSNILSIMPAGDAKVERFLARV